MSHHYFHLRHLCHLKQITEIDGSSWIRRNAKCDQGKTESFGASTQFDRLAILACRSKKSQDKIFRRKRLSTDANFVHVYIEIWDKGYTKV